MDKISELATKYTNKAKQQTPADTMGPLVALDLAWLHGCFQEMGLEMTKYNERLIKHLAFSVNHGTFDPFVEGGCCCDLCSELLDEAKTQRENEARAAR